MSENSEIVDIANQIKAEAFNRSIAPRIPQLLSLLKSDEWINGIAAWLASSEKELDRKLRFGCKTRDDDQFVRGQLAMITEILDLPRHLEHITRVKEDEKKKAASRGRAGY